MLIETAGFQFAEVQVIDRGDAGQQLARRPLQRAHHGAIDGVLGVGLQPFEPLDSSALVRHDQVIGDSGDGGGDGGHFS